MADEVALNPMQTRVAQSAEEMGDALYDPILRHAMSPNEARHILEITGCLLDDGFAVEWIRDTLLGLAISCHQLTEANPAWARINKEIARHAREH